MSYKINIHAHSIFSDGISSPYKMAVKVKELGFTSLVITDHYYGIERSRFITKDSMRLLRKACKEAKEILPVIIGIEIPFMGEEVLVFGGAAIKEILDLPKLPNMEEMLDIKKRTGCGVILCHPASDFEAAAPAVDGYERINSGHDMFVVGDNTRGLGSLENKPAWCNSDAHNLAELNNCYNIVNSKIETEVDLIKYIKKGHQPEFVVNGRGYERKN